MSLYRCSLKPGIFLNHLKNDRFKTGYFSLNFILPLSIENVAYYALLPRVLRSGCESLPNRRAIVKRLEELYGADIYVRHYGRGDKQIISFAADFIDRAYLPQDERADVFSETLAVLRDLIFSPIQQNGLFLQEYVDMERRNCADAVRAMINNKQQYAIHRCTMLMCEGETSGIPILGTVEDFENLLPQKLIECYRHMLAHAQVEIFYVGSSSPAALETVSAEFFCSKMDGRELPQTQSARILHANTAKQYEETANAVQGKLVLGFRTGVFLGDTTQFAYSLFNEIYGGSPSSKLFLNVREKKSLCYSCYAHADLLNGIMYVAAGIDREQKDVAIKEILLQLDKTRQNEISQEELYYAKQSLANGYRSLYDSPEALEVWYLRRILAGSVLTPEEVIERIMQVTAQDVAAIAQRVSLDTIYFLRGDGTCTDEEGEEDD
ncbi:MAG: insulinase family protein [Clostridia bacterium]|nr:insulinase family protein [Clostridia bacterium]